MSGHSLNMPPAPLAIVLISLNESHNMRSVLENITELAQEVSGKNGSIYG